MELFLIDADVIIWCAEQNKLDTLFKNKEIKMPKKIFEEINYKVDLVTTEESGIDLSKYIENGSLKIIDSALSETIRKLRKTYKICPQLAEIQDGEIECIALLLENSKYKFCTGDITAMKVVGFLQLSKQAISLEELIGSLTELRDDFTKECLKNNLKVGSKLYVQYGNWS